MYDLVLPADLKESAQEITELEQALIAARATARDRIVTHYHRGASARQLSKINGGPFSYLTTLKIVERSLATTTQEDRRLIASTRASIF